MNKKNVVLIYLYIGIKARKDEVLVYVTAWLNLEKIIISEKIPITKDYFLNDSIYMNYLG